ncbi:MAG: response regulator [Lachnospiraceae bacterium]|nr:response regulator [Lachnospiraceae bacterium]
MGSTKKVLVCDDSIMARKQLKDNISQCGIEVEFIEGNNGQEAIDLYNQHKPDMVFLDIVMPEKDGATAAKEILESDSSAIVIMASSIGTQQQLKNAIEAGAKDFIQKPLDLEQVKKVFLAHLGGE